MLSHEELQPQLQAVLNQSVAADSGVAAAERVTFIHPIEIKCGEKRPFTFDTFHFSMQTNGTIREHGLHISDAYIQNTHDVQYIRIISVSNPVGKVVCNLLYVYPAVTSTGPSLHKDVASMVNR